ncbi:DUF1488 family protein [Caballeronia sp. LZ001]|uniref:DUF1488 family protein n=1 Tax=Caballeronia sp. LZ001 TaxID=3038553 RepID=UPI0028571D2D|nr:DUF1488 family protein [Caballeronia sp. LZ001]MDR5806544.1 DUF1488 family protein [Caballeronia sp. LZ001]
MKEAPSESQFQLTRDGVEFAILKDGRRVECVILLGALQQCFWLDLPAHDERIRQCFVDGYARIRAMAERKSLVASSDMIRLTPTDFLRR